MRERHVLASIENEMRTARMTRNLGDLVEQFRSDATALQPGGHGEIVEIDEASIQSIRLRAITGDNSPRADDAIARRRRHGPSDVAAIPS